MNFWFNGPAATARPYNQKFITRHYGFGTQCTAPTPGNAACNTVSSVTIGGVNAPVTAWSDTSITVTVPSLPTTGPNSAQCFGTSSASLARFGVCGELVIT